MVNTRPLTILQWCANSLDPILTLGVDLSPLIFTFILSLISPHIPLIGSAQPPIPGQLPKSSEFITPVPHICLPTSIGPPHFKSTIAKNLILSLLCIPPLVATIICHSKAAFCHLHWCSITIYQPATTLSPLLRLIFSFFNLSLALVLEVGSERNLCLSYSLVRLGCLIAHFE